MKFRVLVVEDEPDTSNAIMDLLSELPSTEFALASNQDEAHAALERAVSSAQPFDVAVLDFKLPSRAGELPETNQNVFRAIRNKMPETVVLHTSAYPSEEGITQQIIQEITRPTLNPKSFFLPMTSGWTDDLKRLAYEAYSKRSLLQTRPERHATHASCFISYSHFDEEFVNQLYSRLKNKGLSVWFAAEHMKPGQKLADEIETGIRYYEKLLLVISSASMCSPWVATEIRTAMEEEKRTGRRKLFPIRLVDFAAVQSWRCFNADVGKDMAVELREYFIQDFTDWRDPAVFRRKLKKLIAALKLGAHEAQ